MAVVKGMLMQIKGRQGVLMTNEGDFVKVKLPNKPLQLGEEIEAPIWRSSTPLITTIASAVAALMLVLLIPAYQYMSLPQTVAYVALDINPSVELGIDKNLKVIQYNGLNEDGQKLVSEVNISGLELNQALPLLVEQAVLDEYLKPGIDNVVLSTVTVIGEDSIKIEQFNVQETICQTLIDKEINVRVVLEHMSPEMRKQAQQSQLSPGKYLLLQEAQKSGVEITADEVRGQGILQLEQDKDMRVEKFLNTWIPPGQLKKIDTPENAEGIFIPPGIQKQLEGEQQSEKDTWVPPGQLKKMDNPKEHERIFIPPGIQKQLDGEQQSEKDTWIPPGQAKKQEYFGEEKTDNDLPPGLQKK